MTIFSGMTVAVIAVPAPGATTLTLMFFFLPSAGPGAIGKGCYTLRAGTQPPPENDVLWGQNKAA